MEPFKTRRHVAGRLGALACAASMILGGGLADVAQAQQELEEITVTGSRIVRRDFEANSPIMTVDEEMLDTSSTVAIETVLNELPQFVPAVTQFVTQEVQSTATTTPGASTLSLRGLGSNRNLVLLDGRRAMPVNASGAVDINTIPSAAIQRVETITGGASSVYGADAMAGVVNFILKRDFEGIDFDMQYSETAEGDAEEWRISGVLGSNFAGGDGNVLIGVSHSRRGKALQGDREFYRAGWADPTVSGTEFFVTDTSYVAPSDPFFGPPANNPADSDVQDVFAGAPGGVATSGNFYLNTDGSLYKTTANGSYRYGGPFVVESEEQFLAGEADYGGPFLPEGAQFRKIEGDGTLSENQIQNMISIPMERYSVFGRGLIDLGDNVSGFAQANFSESETRTLLQFSPALGGWGTMIPHGDDIYEPSVVSFGADGLPNTADAGEDMTTLPAYQDGGPIGIACDPVGGCTNSETWPTTPELTRLLDSRPNENAPWELSHVMTWAGPRRTQTRVTSYQAVMGLEGQFDVNDWTWELYGSHGSTQTGSTFGGFGSLERYRTVVSAPNYGRGFFFQGNEEGDGFGGGLGQCTSGLPIMEEFIPSQDCIESVTADLQNQSEMTQDIVEFNVQGGFAELPAGEARFALGTSYRQTDYFFFTDILTSQQSFLDSGIGLFPAGNSEGELSAREQYGELLLPLVADTAAADSFNLELGYRYSDHEPSGSIETYKALLDWRVNDLVRFRGGRNIANRAPNIAELFQSRTQTLEVTFEGDLCSEANPVSSLSANPALNPDNAADVRALCAELMGDAGAAAFYDPANDQPNFAFGFSFQNLVGNSDLQNETAETYTFGAVFSIADRTTLSVDWYNIAISDMISAETAAAVYRRCLSPATNPAFDSQFAPCQRIVRDPQDGTIAPTDVTYSNEGALETTGVDIQLDWGTDVGPGSLNLSTQASYLQSMKTRVSPAAPWTEWVGTAGPNDLTGVQGGSYDYRMFSTLSYFANQGWGLTLRWRHLPSRDPAAAASDPTTNLLPTDDYNIFDLSGSYSFGGDDSYLLRYGIDNLFDVDPEITAAETGDDPSSGLGSTSEGFYDVLGRRYYVGFALQF